MSVERKLNRALAENDVRLKASVALNGLMEPQDTAAMEPLGYTGWAARNKTIYDFPGLGSKVAVAALKDMKPNYLLLRPDEIEQLREMYPSTFELYSRVDHIAAPPDERNISFAGYTYDTGDGDFSIFKRSDTGSG